ncbi:MAG: L-threonylcarbamoyladenylate synthase [Kiritimatiellia bacterium]|jgi:protein-tyrosine phosphatase
MIVRTDTPATRAAIVAEAAGILLHGGVVVLPTDTVYGLAAHPAHPGAVARLYEIKGRADGKPVALLASDTDAITKLGGKLSAAARRMATRFWPGALTLVVDCEGCSEGVRIPDHELARAIIAACGGLLRVTSANRAGEPPALTAEAALHDVGTLADLVIDGGPVKGGTASTVVRDTPGGWHILREGAISAAALATAAQDNSTATPPHGKWASRNSSPLLLFVCSGNTCRSPMAEALMRARLPSGSRWRVGSAGTMAADGLSASSLARQALAEEGIMLAGHRSRLVTPQLVREAELVVVMERHHFDDIITCYPTARDKVFLLGSFTPQEDGRGIADPVGGTLMHYRQCRDTIKAALPGLMKFLDVLA